MEYGNVKNFVKSHKTEGGTTIINYSGATTNADQINAVNINSNAINTNNLTSKNADIINANILYLMSEEGKINILTGDELKYTNGTINDLKSDVITANKLTVKDTATIENIINNNLQSKNIVTDYLTVNKSAHFFELIIDKIRSVQGTQINTAANCIVDFVEGYDSNDNLVDIQTGNVAYYRIYWKNTDDDGRAITNDWLVYDQALCESFNVGAGVSYDVSNKYYWRLVTNTDNGVPKYINLATGDVKSTQPSDYQIRFPNGFKFNIDDQQASDFTDFNVTSQISGQWDNTTKTWTCTTTDFGLQLTYFTDNIDSEADQYYFVSMPFEFTTNIKTKLNIGVYYADGSFDYFPATTYKTSYSIITAYGKQIEAIIINSAVIDLYEACNWIDLSNTDMDATISGKSAIPSVGDNVCQLGYRYDQLTNPTQDDIARASAIIIAAYKTPDTGIIPPSYAQYQNIGADSSYRWDLGHYRGSYFDAERAKFIGEFEVDVNGNKVSLDQYIQSYNNANPLEAYVSTNNNEYFDLIVMQTDNNNEIHGLNNFPSNMQILLSYNNSTLFDPSEYDVLTLNLFGVTYDLLDSNYDPNNYLPSGYEGIYLQNLYPAHAGMTPSPFRLIFNFIGSDQTITSTSMTLHGEIIDSGTTYQINKTISVSSVSSIEGTDGELFLLNKITEDSVVKSNKSLNTLLRYSINHIVGTSAQIITPTTEKLIIERYNVNNQIIDTTTRLANQYDSTNGYWEYTDTMVNWYDPNYTNNKPYYYVVKLCDAQNNILYNTIVRVQVDNASFFSVTDGLLNSVQANSNSISQISQSVDNINLSVTDLGDDIDDINNGLRTTGIDISHGRITLDAETTEMTGNFNLKGHFTGDIESYNDDTKNRVKITTSSAGTNGIIMSGPDMVDQFTGEPYPNVQEVDLIRMEFTTTSGARAGSIKVKSAESSNIYTNIWQESVSVSNDQNYVTVRPEGISYGLRGSQTYDFRKSADEQGISMSWPATLCGSYTTIKKVNSGSYYNAKLYEGVIILQNGIVADFELILPAPNSESAGKWYFIKNRSNLTGGDCVVTCVGSSSSNKLIMDDNSLSLDVSRDLDHDSIMLFCDGECWIIFSARF